MGMLHIVAKRGHADNIEIIDVETGKKIDGLTKIDINIVPCEPIKATIECYLDGLDILANEIEKNGYCFHSKKVGDESD